MDMIDVKNGSNLNLFGRNIRVEKEKPWNEIVEKFTDLVQSKEYPMSYKRMATILAPLKKANGTDWLKSFYFECEKKGPKYFWWSIKYDGTKKEIRTVESIKMEEGA